MRELLEAIEGGLLLEIRLQDIRRRTERPIHERARTLTTKLTGQLKGRNTWFFETSGGSRPWIQKVKAHPGKSSRSTLVWEQNITTMCGCPAWLWWGSQWNAVKAKYQYGLPIPKLLPPNINDPEREKFACKHVISVSEWIRDNKLKLNSRGK